MSCHPVHSRREVIALASAPSPFLCHVPFAISQLLHSTSLPSLQLPSPTLSSPFLPSPPSIIVVVSNSPFGWCDNHRMSCCIHGRKWSPLPLPSPLPSSPPLMLRTRIGCGGHLGLLSCPRACDEPSKSLVQMTQRPQSLLLPPSTSLVSS